MLENTLLPGIQKKQPSFNQGWFEKAPARGGPSPDGGGGVTYLAAEHSTAMSSHLHHVLLGVANTSLPSHNFNNS